VEQPSTTAETVALFRALETVRPARERLFEDPIASRFLRPSLRVAIGLAKLPPLRLALEALSEHLWPGACSSAVASTRLIDDWLRDAQVRGIEQFVLLGSGFDARASRLAALRGAKVFELDRRATLQAKRTRLAAPGHADVRYLPIDFGRHDFINLMRTSDFDRRAPAVFVWEGVTQYLPPAAVERTLRSIARLCTIDSELLFTYVHRGALAGELAKTAEPWLSGMVPEEVPSMLHERGFEVLEDLDADAYRQRYRAAPRGGWGGYAFSHAVRARYTRPAAPASGDSGLFRDPV
jgi:methyltransferase (TIGR00027 family)